MFVNFAFLRKIANIKGVFKNILHLSATDCLFNFTHF